MIRTSRSGSASFLESFAIRGRERGDVGQILRPSGGLLNAEAVTGRISPDASETIDRATVTFSGRPEGRKDTG